MLTAHPPQTTGQAESTAVTAPREVFLDAVRTLALARVVLWHTVGAAFLTYFVAAVPAMFFVTGSLLAKSLRRGARRVVLDRARRILVPLWVFTVGAYVAMAVSHLVDRTPQTALPWRDLPVWLLPFADPHGSPWEGGYLSSPLWYLRALLWLIVLSPVLLALVRRRPLLAFMVPLGGLALLEWAARTGRWQGTWAWRVGDLALYGTFLMLGFLHRDGRLDGMSRRAWMGAALVNGAAAALWCATQPVPDHVVNDSHPAHLLVGLSWLCLFFWARPFIERCATGPVGGPFIRWANQRSITIYLWHSTAVVVSFELLRGLGVSWLPGVWVAALLALTGFGTLLLVLGFGWVEDLANRRPPRLWPGAKRVRSAVLPRQAVLAFAVTALATLLAAALTTTSVTTVGGRSVGMAVQVSQAAEPGSTTTSALSTTTTSKRPTLRVPSQQPKAPVFVPDHLGETGAATAPARVAAPAPSAASTTTTPHVDGQTVNGPTVTAGSGGQESSLDVTLGPQLEAILSAWMVDNAVPGAQLAVYRPGQLDWSTARGTDPTTGLDAAVDDRFDVASITKTFTAALVWRAVDQGLLNPDDPIGRLAAVPDFPYTDLTPRQLLNHSSGLANFRDTPEFNADPASADTPAKAVALAARQPLGFPPGGGAFYSSTNYLVLGFVLEQVTGRSFERQLADVVKQAGLGTAPLAPPGPGSPNFASAGLQMTVGQVAHWGIALLSDNTVGLSDGARQEMIAIDPNTSLGPGLWGYCPCTTRGGYPHWAGVGHTGSTTVLQFSPDSMVSIAVNLTDSAWVPDTRQDALLRLFEDLRAAVLASPST